MDPEPVPDVRSIVGNRLRGSIETNWNKVTRSEAKKTCPVRSPAQTATNAVNLSNLALVSYLNVDFSFIARTNLLNVKRYIS